MRQILAYVAMLMRAYVRDRSALFFGFLFPLIFMILFGVLDLGGVGTVNVGIVDEAGNAESARFVASLARIDVLRITTGTRAGEQDRLAAGERDVVLILPSDFRIAPSGPPPTVTLILNGGRPQQAQIGSVLLSQAVDELSFAVTRTQPVVTLRREEVKGRSLRYVDFLTPGVLGMTIMQSGISSVAFAFVIWRQRGVLRRIMATPISRRRFLAAHVLQRLAALVGQVLVLLAVAVIGFKVAVLGSMALFLAVGILGGIVFLCLGFAVSGIVATENAVPPVTQLVTLPQLFLSGVFFSKDAAPPFLRPIAEVLPLTYLNDALRAVATQGATIDRILPQLAGLAVWAVISFVLAFRFFRLEV